MSGSIFVLLLLSSFYPLSHGISFDSSQLPCCPDEELRVLVKQWNSFWNAGTSGAVKIAFAQEYGKRLMERSELYRYIIDTVLGGLSSPGATAFVIRDINLFTTAQNLLHNLDVVFRYVEPVIKRDASTPGMDVKVIQMWFQTVLEVISETLGEYDSVIWETCTARITDIYIKLFKEQKSANQLRSHN